MTTRVALVISSLACGGAERVMSQLANAWSERGIEVSLLTWSSASEQDFYPLDPGVSRVRVAVPDRERQSFGKTVRNLRTAWALRRELRRIKPQAVLSFMDATNVLCVIACAGLGARLVIAERTDPGANAGLPAIWRSARRYLYRYADVVTAQTARAAQWLERECHTPVQVIPNYIRPMPAPASLADRSLVVLCVGRLVDEKGFDRAIDAFARVVTRHPAWRLDILGSGPQLQALQAQAARLGVLESVHFHGTVDNVPDWMERVSIVLAPSRFEGFPNALLEAMAMGVACLSTDCPSGPAELIQHRVNGLLVNNGDDEALAQSLDELMADALLRQSLGKRAMDVRQTYALEGILPRWSRALAIDGGQ